MVFCRERNTVYVIREFKFENHSYSGKTAGKRYVIKILLRGK